MCNRLDLETLRFWPIMLKNIPIVLDLTHCEGNTCGLCSICTSVVWQEMFSFQHIGLPTGYWS